ncbi:MAG: hypothetical protein Q8P67_08820 [archaeon]|nr:hypothetical protein [archaeon]
MAQRLSFHQPSSFRPWFFFALFFRLSREEFSRFEDAAARSTPVNRQTPQKKFHVPRGGRERGSLRTSNHEATPPKFPASTGGDWALGLACRSENGRGE